MPLKLFTTLIILYLLMPISSRADCIWGTPFIDNTANADLIVHIKILKLHKAFTLADPPTYLEAEVLQIYQGESVEKLIKVVEDPLLGVPLHVFTEGTEWIFTLYRTDSHSYILPECAYGHLRVETLVTGYLTESFSLGRQFIPFIEFPQLLAAPNTVELDNPYEQGVNAGRQQCIDDPIGCGINQEPTAIYVDGKLTIPFVKVLGVAGELNTYSVELIQKGDDFVFELDLESLELHHLK